MKDLSCGVIVTDGLRLLAIVPWGKRNSLDLPKGHLNPGEMPRDCAVRELEEETSLSIKPALLKDLGRFEYTSYKDLHLFLYRTSFENFDVTKLQCKSTFTNSFGKEVPEATAFQLVDYNDKRFYSSLKPILFLVQKSL